jgi:hypothetical protein
MKIKGVIIGLERYSFLDEYLSIDAKGVQMEIKSEGSIFTYFTPETFKDIGDEIEIEVTAISPYTKTHSPIITGTIVK